MIGIWSAVEPGLGITAASLATLRPLLRVARERVRSKLSNYSPNGTGRFTNSSTNLSNPNPRQSRTLDMEETNDRDDQFTFSDKAVKGIQHTPKHANEYSSPTQESYVVVNATPELAPANNHIGATDLEAGHGLKARSDET